jgi:hypothetical protein
VFVVERSAAQGAYACGDAADDAWALLANGALAASAARCDEVRYAAQRLDAEVRCLGAKKQIAERARCLAIEVH